MSETNRHCLNFGDEPGFTVKDCENTGTEPKCDLCAARDLTALREELAEAKAALERTKTAAQRYMTSSDGAPIRKYEEARAGLIEAIGDVPAGTTTISVTYSGPESREAPEPQPDEKRGLYQKYQVTRLHDPSGKHRECEFYVLDLIHDGYARAALLAYAAACEDEFPKLARDLAAKLNPRASSEETRLARALAVFLESHQQPAPHPGSESREPFDDTASAYYVCVTCDEPATAKRQNGEPVCALHAAAWVVCECGHTKAEHGQPGCLYECCLGFRPALDALRAAPTGSIPAQTSQRSTNQEEHMPKAKQERAVIVGNGPCGLYIGETAATDEEILEKHAVRLTNCRHVAHWRGKTGGITSLAQHGPCGPNVKQSRIGAACPSSLLADVKAVHDLSPEAIAAFATIVPTDG